MEKQEKVLKKLKRAGTGSQVNLGKKNNDECYTDMDDILRELKYWGALGKFKGKKIICPCDWDIVEGEDIYSITIEYKDDITELTTNNVFKAVKNIQYDLWGLSEDGNLEIETIEVSEDDIEDFLRDKVTCNFIRTFVAKAKAWGIKSITASGYNPAVDKGIKFQDVDFGKYDVCVTNPPFSLYSKFMNYVLGKIDFILLAPFINRATVSEGVPLMLSKIYLGFSANSSCGYLALNFSNPVLDNAYNTKMVACDWITSFPEAQLERNAHPSLLCIDYELYKDEYEEMENMILKDGTHPIKVKTDAVPDTYSGWMFGPVNLIAKISFDEFEWYLAGHGMNYLNEHLEISPFKGVVTTDILKHNGKNGFDGIIFRRKSKREE